MARTKRQAAQVVLREVKRMFKPYIADGSGPTLVKDFAWYGLAPYAVVWEGGPYDWAITASGGGVNEEDASLGAEFGIKPKQYEPVRVEGAYIEPITGWALGIWPEEVWGR